jgi:hypothetical protein
VSIAAFWGKSVGYSEVGKHVTIETINGRIAVISKECFDYLYYRLDDFTAALKEDCIEYAIHLTNKPLLQYPDWYVSAVYDEWICKDDYGGWLFYDIVHGGIPMSSESIVMRNYIGKLRYMESEEFCKHFDITGE